MKTKQLGAFSLILALFFGARTANHGDPAAHASPARSEATHSAKDNVAAHSSKAAPVPAGDHCSNSAANVQFQKTHWWLAPHSAQGCFVSLSPVWRQICKINPAPGEDLSGQTLTEDKFLAACLGKPRSIHSMMAAVPNPQRTHLGLMTDRAIEALQVAAAEAHFLPLSHYLPWSPPGSEPAGSAESSEENRSDADDPGVLVFHDADPPSTARPSYLLVFLIPEMPTEGLDRVAFSNASKMIEKVSPNMAVLSFAGPNFSGSVGSLRELEKEPGGTKCIHAVSGSVTNADDYDATKTGCSTFTKTQTGDHEALCEFVKGAAAFGYSSKQIAILSEEGTQYGRQGPADETPNAAPCKPDESAQLWFLHFPREISKLRNAYGAETGKASSSESTPQTGLGLQWQDAESAQRDDLKTYGDRQTPLSQEAVLSTLSITLKAQGIKALGILATDPMDEAFLIHSIKESSPDVRLFVRDPDLLFLRAPDVASLNGTLLISNYPLIPENQFWSSTNDQKDQADPDERHLITFPSAFQEGEYNAFTELMDQAGWAPIDAKGKRVELKRLEWNWPAGMAANQEADPPGKPKRRPLWLATIGTAGHYPIKVLNYNRKEINKAELKLHSLDLGPPQFLPIAFWGLMAGLGLLHALGLSSRSAVPSYFKHDFDLSDRASTVTLVKLFCHMMAIVTVALAQMILGSSYLFFYRSGWRYSVLAASVGVVTVLLLSIAAVQLAELYSLYRQQRRIATPDASSKIISADRIFWTGIVGAVIMVGAGVFWCVMTVVEDRFDNAFLHFRDLSLSSGVAPTLPLASVLLVLYFGIWAYLRRLSYWKHRYVDMFGLKLDQVIDQDLHADVGAIDTCLLGPLENRKWMTVFWALFGLSIVAFRPWITLDMIEPSRVWRFALFFFGLALLTLWLNWFRFINIWVHLRNILEQLENLPIRTAFQRLPREKSLPILHWSSPQNSFLLRQVLDRLRALARVDTAAQALQTSFEAKMNALMTSGVVKMKVVAEQRVVGGSTSTILPIPSRRREDHLREARAEMTKITGMLSDQLRQQYWGRGSAGTKEDQEPPAADLHFVLAEDIVALPFYAYIQKIVGELRNILFFLGIAVSLLFAALHTYAFRADEAIDWWFIGLFAFMGGGIVLVIAQMERNALLSRFSDRTPGELGGSFYLQLLKYGTVPFLTIFGSQVPSISNLVLKWVQPALEALH